MFVGYRCCQENKGAMYMPNFIHNGVHLAYSVQGDDPNDL